MRVVNNNFVCGCKLDQLLEVIASPDGANDTHGLFSF